MRNEEGLTRITHTWYSASEVRWIASRFHQRMMIIEEFLSLSLFLPDCSQDIERILPFCEAMNFLFSITNYSCTSKICMLQQCDMKTNNYHFHAPEIQDLQLKSLGEIDSIESGKSSQWNEYEMSDISHHRNPFIRYANEWLREEIGEGIVVKFLWIEGVASESIDQFEDYLEISINPKRWLIINSESLVQRQWKVPWLPGKVQYDQYQNPCPM